MFATAVYAFFLYSYVTQLDPKNPDAKYQLAAWGPVGNQLVSFLRLY